LNSGFLPAVDELHVLQEMKATLILALALTLTVQVQAFDSAGPPPDKTIEWTTGYLSKVIVPRVDFDRTTSLGQCLNFLELVMGRPAAYNIKIDGEALGVAKLSAPVSLKVRDMKLIEILAKLADAVDANLVIERGNVSLIPKKEAEQAVAPNRSLPPSQKSTSPVRGSED
jgi:hypothetical protein